MRPLVKKMARCREQQGEENGEDARPGVKNPSMLNISKIPRGSAGPTLKALHRQKESIMQAKNNLDSNQEQLDQEMADVVKAIAVNTNMLVKKSLLTVKKEGQEAEEVARRLRDLERLPFFSDQRASISLFRYANKLLLTSTLLSSWMHADFTNSYFLVLHFLLGCMQT